MMDWWEKNFATCELGEPLSEELRERRLDERAMLIGKALSQGFGKALSEIFNGARVLKRAYEFLRTPKLNFPS
ncbi:MAG: IS4/Tn5 family transposase DNA-binding protein [Nostochopsis sp.]